MPKNAGQHDLWGQLGSLHRTGALASLHMAQNSSKQEVTNFRVWGTFLEVTKHPHVKTPVGCHSWCGP